MQAWVPRGNEQALANKSKIMASHLFGGDPEPPQYQQRQAPPPQPEYNSPPPQQYAPPPREIQTFPEADDTSFTSQANHTITLYSNDDYQENLPNLPDFDIPIIEPPSSFDIPVIRTRPNFVATGKRLSPLKRDTFLQVREELENDSYERRTVPQTKLPMKTTKKLKTK